jgi:hypothetical protein
MPESNNHNTAIALVLGPDMDVKVDKWPMQENLKGHSEWQLVSSQASYTIFDVLGGCIDDQQTLVANDFDPVPFCGAMSIVVNYTHSL